MNDNAHHLPPAHFSARGRDVVAGWVLSLLMVAGLAAAAPFVQTGVTETASLQANDSGYSIPAAPTRARC
jgi:hypothetical protein